MRSRLVLLAPLLALGWMMIAPPGRPGNPLGGAAPARQAAPDPVKYIDLTVSLEWQPGAADSLRDDLALAGCAPAPGDAEPEERYLDDLKTAMRSFSKYLYQATEGQAALREVKVHPGGVNWDRADIRILAGTNADPMAFVGGDAAAPTPFSPRAGLTYMAYPRGIILGRLWNGAASRCGAWSAPAGWRTLGHEWAHHEFYLWDEYFNYFTQAEQFCSSTGMSPPARVGGAAASPLADSLMAYQYGANKFWLKPSPMPPGCADTPQQVINQGSDWQTISRFHPELAPPAASTPGPDFEASAAAAAFRFEVVAPAAPADASAPLRLEHAATGSVTANGYVIIDGPAGPQRIIGQGELLPGETKAFWGAAPGSRAALDLQDWRTGERRAYPARYAAPPPLDPDKLNQAAPAATTWRPAFAITPILSTNQIPGATEVAGLRVTVSECTRTAKQIIQLGYCPAGSPCSALQNVPVGPGDRYEHTFSFPIDGQIAPPADSGYVYARNAATGEEAVAWYQFGGGLGPAHTIGHTPLLDGAVSVSLPHGSSLPPVDTQVIYSNAQLCAAGPPFIEPPILGIASGPIAIQVVRSDRPGAGWGASDPPLNIRLSYDEDLINRQGIGEEQLVVLRMNGNKWQLAAERGRSKARDWIALAPQPFAGGGEVFAFGYVAQQTALPLLSR